ncbi:MAG: Rho termination factor N-terminal domain-containing protein [Candidatus Sulfobium sp.]|jgi:hypothetical protein
MKEKDIREIAKKMGIRIGKMKKPELIRAIQNAEGNIPCYATRGHECDQINCLWREDCIKAVQT